MPGTKLGGGNEEIEEQLRTVGANCNCSMCKFLTLNTFSKKNGGVGSSKLLTFNRNIKKQTEIVRTNFVKSPKQVKVLNKQVKPESGKR